MQQKNSAESFFNDIQSTMKQLLDASPVTSAFDLKTILDAQRKNMQAFTEANQCAMNGWQALAKRQAEMVSKFVQNNSGIASKTFSAAAPQETIARQTELLKTACEEVLQCAREAGDILRKNTAEAAEILNRRVMASLGEIKSSPKKSEDA